MLIFIFTEDDNLYNILKQETEKFSMQLHRIKDNQDIDDIFMSRFVKDGVLFVDEQISASKETYDISIRMRRNFSEGNFLTVLMTECQSAVDMAATIEYYQFDDFLIKPFPPRCFIAKIRAISRVKERFLNKNKHKSLKCGPMTLDPDTLKIIGGKEEVELTKNQFDVLYSLASNIGRTMSRSEIIKSIRGDNYSVIQKVVDVEVSRIRKKLPENLCKIKTVRRVGYRFEIIKKDD